MVTAEDLPELIQDERRRAGRPITVGISGYCGSGKSTLARHLAAVIPGSLRMRGDDFLDPARSHQRSHDWDGVERERLVTDVLAPFQESRASQFQRYDWSRRELGAVERLPLADVLLVDLIGLFHPQALKHLDVTFWMDVDLTVATERGMARDQSLGRNHESLWRDVWIPNERDFGAEFDPRSAAEFFVTAE
ncbi:uridine kinase family protein [Microterricola gilva]|nr:phosphoglycerate transporter [Microterricola gilva]